MAALHVRIRRERDIEKTGQGFGSEAESCDHARLRGSRVVLGACRPRDRDRKEKRQNGDEAMAGAHGE
jgi:hypothetical protein